ncbi:hypothetical protein RchiOBHm_Chr0c29g0501151 [Rosa chinensis]|uniref:Uncharacterized protein n=1 Tax=Rosa chinensis TaxID=74649 RepID=A0A2P6SQE1_ROSCH|nr:hypothetical protein RchiOBHm_Chr0c29g0501151 [Rosa chinensis]
MTSRSARVTRRLFVFDKSQNYGWCHKRDRMLSFSGVFYGIDGDPVFSLPAEMDVGLELVFDYGDGARYPLLELVPLLTGLLTVWMAAYRWCYHGGGSASGVFRQMVNSGDGMNALGPVFGVNGLLDLIWSMGCIIFLLWGWRVSVSRAYSNV